MPRLWNDTIEAHRTAVRHAVLDAAAALVADHGLTGVTMSGIAELTGIGRATLYKYFPDVEAILLAWHERQVTHHLDHLHAIRDNAVGPSERLHAVLAAYARLSRHRQGGDLAAALHRGDHATEAHARLHALLRELITDAAEAGQVRDDIPADELAAFCQHALSASATVTSDDGLHRLVRLTLTALHAAADRPTSQQAPR
ncbi:TetR/AcrR family transcriptional regulator [Micromonospora sp. NPDC049374]|uniref:TetR/AcrR family transcriptional regulator n=1 Tax=Micromonospora sp. NPDC049374 TaxID=3154352 RepID=UPI0034186FE6